MMDIMTGLTAISETLKISKELRNIDREIDKAELKLRLADLVDGLLEAKEALQDAKERERELRNEITSLTEQLSAKGQYEDEDGCLFKLDGNGERVGVPFCNYCHVKESKLFRVNPRPATETFPQHHWCDNCHNRYYRHR